MSNHTKKSRRKKSNNKNITEKNEEITLTTLYHMMKEGFNRIEKDISILKDDMKGVHKYIKLESKFQELRNRNFIVKAYLHNHNQHSVIVLSTTMFINPFGKEITDLDGFLLIRTYPNDVKQPSQDLISRLPQANFIESL